MTTVGRSRGRPMNLIVKGVRHEYGGGSHPRAPSLPGSGRQEGGGSHSGPGRRRVFGARKSRERPEKDGRGGHPGPSGGPRGQGPRKGASSPSGARGLG